MLIDKGKIFSIIENRNPKSIALSGPEGIWSELIKLAKEIEEKYSIEVFILGEPNYGSCDIEVLDLKKSGADILFNIGHMTSSGKIGENIYFIDAFYDIDFDEVVPAAISILRKYNFSKISIFTINNHLNKIERVKARFRREGFKILEPKEDHMVKSGQVLGCYYKGPLSVKDEVDAYIFLGQSVFHAVGIYLVTKKPTYMLDPFFKEVKDVSKEAGKLEKRAILSTIKTMESKNIGIIFGLRGTQFQKFKALALKKELEKLGKKVYLIGMREILPERIDGINGIDSFIILACPRIALDVLNFKKPVLSYLQAKALVKLLKGQRTVEIFEEGIWI